MGFKAILIKVLPNIVIRYLSLFKKNYLDGWALKSYSQEGEDMVLRRLFEKQKFGFYIDVGAHHPKRFSNTYFFYKQGWCGINIDAMPDSMKAFDKVRPKDINIEKPISDKDQTLTYYAFNEPALNSFSKRLSEERSGKNGYFIKFTQNIKTTTLENILDKSLPKGREIDFLSIDVEGLDFAVLKSNNFKKYRPKVILIEILDGENPIDLKSNKVVEYLTNNNYSVYVKLIHTVIFINNDFIKKLR